MKKGCVVFATHSGASKAMIDGVVIGNTFVVEECVEVNGQKLLRVSSPSGLNEWSGNWSQMSNEWTPELRKQLEYEESDTDFFLECNDYKTFFYETTICLPDNNKIKTSSLSFDFASPDSFSPFSPAQK